MFQRIWLYEHTKYALDSYEHLSWGTFITSWNSVWLISIFYLWWPNWVTHNFRKSRKYLVCWRNGREVASLARSAPSDHWCRPVGRVPWRFNFWQPREGTLVKQMVMYLRHDQLAGNARLLLVVSMRLNLFLSYPLSWFFLPQHHQDFRFDCQ